MELHYRHGHPLRRRATRPPPPAWFGAAHSEYELHMAGCRRWLRHDEPETFPGEGRLWLLPASWVEAIPEGLPVVSVSGASEDYAAEAHRELNDDGALDVGLIAARPAPRSDQLTDQPYRAGPR